MTKDKRAGVICTFPTYDITHRERYERALDDPSLLPGDDPGNPFLVAQLRAVSAHLQGLDVRMQGIEGRMASIEELLQARGGAESTSAPREEPATSTPDSSASSDDEDIDMNTTESLAQECPMETPLLLMTWLAELVGLTDACCAL
ncbi:hypothetical protein GQ600_24441 [Phytophthora cactorum]|nr:hypothetical protein GQ600_24441 [Phytophthora cactorum]